MTMCSKSIGLMDGARVTFEKNTIVSSGGNALRFENPSMTREVMPYA